MSYDLFKVNGGIKKKSCMHHNHRCQQSSDQHAELKVSVGKKDIHKHGVNIRDFVTIL